MNMLKGVTRAVKMRTLLVFTTNLSYCLLWTFLVIKKCTFWHHSLSQQPKQRRFQVNLSQLGSRSVLFWLWLYINIYNHFCLVYDFSTKLSPVYHKHDKFSSYRFFTFGQIKLLASLRLISVFLSGGSSSLLQGILVYQHMHQLQKYELLCYIRVEIL